MLFRSFLDFVAGAELIIHNAPFDVGFLNSELGRIDRENLEHHVPSIIDTLKMAKDMRPGQRFATDDGAAHGGVRHRERREHRHVRGRQFHRRDARRAEGRESAVILRATE